MQLDYWLTTDGDDVTLRGTNITIPARMEAVMFTEPVPPGDPRDRENPLVPSVTWLIEVVDGEPGCTALTIRHRPGQPITRADLSRLPNPTEFVRVLVALVSSGGEPDDPLNFERATEALAAYDGIRRRRTVTPHRLTEVAAAYRRGGANAVATELHVSRSQAFRLARQARERGY